MLAIGGAAAALVFVTAIVLFMVFGLGGDDNGNGDNGDVQGVTASPIATPAAESGTPDAAATPQPGSEEDPEEASTPESDETAEATPTAEPEVAGTPQETTPVETTPTAAATEAPTPVVGDFGELPAADIPSGSNVPGQLSLEYRLDMSLQQVPAESSAYLFETRTWTADEVAALAASLGMDGDVVDQGAGSYRVSEGGDLYVSGNLIQYIADTSADPAAGELPANDALIQSARSWLIDNDIVGGNVGNGEVANRNDESGRALVIIRPADPSPILSVIPSASITMGSGGQVLEANIRWPASLTGSRYGLRPAEQLWNDASQGRGYVEIDPELLPEGSVSGVATITSVSVAYTSAGAPDTQQYLVPLVVFNGQAQLDSGGAVPISIYVSAAGAQAAPRG